MNIKEYLKNNIVLLDGGMGTLLQSAGLELGEKPEMWNITHPDTIKEIHRAYYDMGSNIVATNTFGANSLKFSEDELETIITAAVNNAAAARNESKTEHEKFIALDIGPLGRLLKPFGDFDFEEAVGVFATTVKIGAKLGVDLILIETMNDSYETKAALLAAKENCDLPVFVSNAYSENGKLMTGADPQSMVATLEGMGADAIGVNCSLGPKQLAPIVEEYLECASVPIIMKANAGLPKNVDGKTVFDIDAAQFAFDTAQLVKKGVRIAGGCCGTTPQYIKELSSLIKNLKPQEITDKKRTVVSSYTKAVLFGDKPILIGERINPTGKKRFKQALLEGDIDYILAEGFKQQDAGVHILDVNVGLPEIDEKAMLKRTVCELQSVIDLPLQIDTSDISAMGEALRRYNGKALINSVNGKAESMHSIFPLVKKYGGVVVALTLDENGIPETIDGRVKIAEKIINTAKEYGIDKKDIIFDTLVLAVSADKGSAAVTLGALREIKERLEANTILGISNISFGLPNRDYLNSTFFALALENGLSAAIMNPYSANMLKTYYSYNALNGLDQNFNDYINYCSLEPDTPTGAKQDVGTDSIDSLETAIIKGLKEKTAEYTKEILNSQEPLSIIENHIIPALDKVGVGYEKGEVYLPQLLMSAEAAKAAFEVIKSRFSENGQGDKKSKFVIATVEGDIHDIGKNIVKLLLQNYGFNVIDLGKDVPPQKILDAVVKENAEMVGLSALMTTTVTSMEKTITLLRQQAPWCKVVVGGAVLTEEYAKKIGADKYAKDAMEAVRYAEEITSQK